MDAQILYSLTVSFAKWHIRNVGHPDFFCKISQGNFEITRANFFDKIDLRTSISMTDLRDLLYTFSSFCLAVTIIHSYLEIK